MYLCVFIILLCFYRHFVIYTFFFQFIPKSRAERKTVVSQMVVFPQTKSPHHEGIMKFTTFLFVNNENLGAIAHMSNGT